MRALVIVTYVAIGALVAALAVVLLTIVVLLRKIRHTAGLILFGVRAIANQVAPVGPVVEEINSDLIGVRDALQSILDRAGEEPEPEPALADSVGDHARGQGRSGGRGALRWAGDEAE